MKKLLISTILLLLSSPSWATDPASPAATPGAVRPIECPVAGEKCKVLFLNEGEENALMQKNGILDTAAQARNLDLGGIAVYFKTKIGAAVAGEVRSPAKPQGEDGKPGEKPAEPAK